ncbi:MAG: PepSY domain-containing protein [Candidatus Nitrohelix vancouverensis]|uniref:PepSY domain-containing protein n=1 Tax=Candidatus Nitrohelix vancouverensis TaxID=2705534 RepID=A0A7T0G4K9_9BACT|nr:MAG: PepSY domain-containing protein [Candidatus Nitrohelix vancouverensis]
MAVKRARLAARRLWKQTHLYLGLVLGLPFVLVGLTGSCIVFDHRLDEWLNADLLTTNNRGVAQSLDAVVGAARRVVSFEPSSISIAMPRREGAAFVVRLRDSAVDGLPRTMEIMVDPVSGRVLGQRIKDDHLMSLVYDLHWRLLLDEPGRILVGITGLCMIVSIATGLYLWWPSPGKWKRSLKFYKGARPKRFNFDLHRLFGVYSTLVVFVVVFSGVTMSLPGLVEPVVKIFSPLTFEYPSHLKSSIPKNANMISFEEAERKARAVFPDADLQYIYFPDNAEGFIQATLRSPGEVRRTGGASRVYMDAYTGEALLIQRPEEMTAGDVFMEWQFPLHNGEAFGLPGRVIVFISGLLPLILYITGVRIWMNQRRGI